MSIKETNSCHLCTKRWYSILFLKKNSGQNLPFCLPEKNTIPIIHRDFLGFFWWILIGFQKYWPSSILIIEGSKLASIEGFFEAQFWIVNSSRGKNSENYWLFSIGVPVWTKILNTGPKYVLVLRIAWTVWISLNSINQ